MTLRRSFLSETRRFRSNSFNGTNDDNIFLAVLDLTGTATITTPDDPGGPVIPPIPLPATGLLLLGALGLLGARQRLKSS